MMVGLARACVEDVLYRWFNQSGSYGSIALTVSIRHRWSVFGIGVDRRTGWAPGLLVR